MVTAEVCIGAVAALMMAVAWRRGVTGHRTHRRVSRRWTGRTVHIAFQPEGWHPADTPRCPRGEDGKLREEACQVAMRATRAGVVVVGMILAAGLAVSAVLTCVAAAGAELAVVMMYGRYLWWRWQRTRLCVANASPLASVLAYPFRLRASDLVEDMTVNAKGLVEAVIVPTTFRATADLVQDVEAMITAILPATVTWELTARPPVLRLSYDLLPAEALFNDYLGDITDWELVA